MLVTRFAPSPTGLLHLGHALSAGLAARLAKVSGGRLLLRLEDIDTTRCRPAFIDAIKADLDWLGLAFHGPVLVQSSRRAAHDEALARLTGMGVTYPCFCTRADIAAAASAPHGTAPAYPGTCRHIAASEARARSELEPHAVRLNVAAALQQTGPLTWEEVGEEVGEGELPANPRLAGDVVLARKDIGVGYMLAAVADDAFQQVTDIVRGRDLLDATPTQRLLQSLLGLAAPRYHHHRLLLAPDGRRLAKRDRAETLAALRETGVDGPDLTHRLAALPPRGADLHFDILRP